MRAMNIERMSDKKPIDSFVKPMPSPKRQDMQTLESLLEDMKITFLGFRSIIESLIYADIVLFKVTIRVM